MREKGRREKGKRQDQERELAREVRVHSHILRDVVQIHSPNPTLTLSNEPNPESLRPSQAEIQKILNLKKRFFAIFSHFPKS